MSRGVGRRAHFSHAQEFQPKLDAAALVVRLGCRVVFGGVERVAADQEEVPDLLKLVLRHRRFIRRRLGEQDAEHALAALQAEVQVV